MSFDHKGPVVNKRLLRAGASSRNIRYDGITNVSSEYTPDFEMINSLGVADGLQSP